eukprot:CAMPEP_0114272888 /NCGR_PEP_ID=MMETSP0058-20121206/28759_1 /TAXON_ID=36894 /ORGANISM="Pyramimonas parkeae, CCMP726" /LENGTH=74 /DNA_ID=CAMNT_0001392217 /DNA_START=460 /DNA_END=684 /DNA_ORIENTATION=-
MTRPVQLRISCRHIDRLLHLPGTSTRCTSSPSIRMWHLCDAVVGGGAILPSELLGSAGSKVERSEVDAIPDPVW